VAPGGAKLIKLPGVWWRFGPLGPPGLGAPVLESSAPAATTSPTPWSSSEIGGGAVVDDEGPSRVSTPSPTSSKIIEATAT